MTRWNVSTRLLEWLLFARRLPPLEWRAPQGPPWPHEHLHGLGISQIPPEARENVMRHTGHVHVDFQPERRR
ncbi:MAG TPA: hypothetical protein VK942_10100 [Actinomycetes bacterium]|nr:hypothetical protein [Actinomycetes bacterium]